MPKVRLSPLARCPEVSLADRRCPRCGSVRVHGHGRRERSLRDWAYQEVQVRRFRCVACGVTWTVYPQGVSPGGHFSVRAEQLMVLLYVLGLSYRATAAVMWGLGVPVAPSSVLNFVQAQGQRETMERQRRYWQGKGVTVRRIGVDGTGVKMAAHPEDKGIIVVVNEEEGVGLWVAAVDEKDREALAQTLQWVLETFQPEEIVTDEAGAYPEALEQATASGAPQPQHRLCAAHFRRNKVGRLRRLQRTAQARGWGLVVMEMRALETLLKGSSPEVWRDFARRLWRLVRRARAPGKGEQASWHYRWRSLLLDMSEKAPQVTGVTNNRTEQLIGRAFKIRTRSMRGFKRTDNRIRFLHLALTLDERAQRDGWLYLL